MLTPELVVVWSRRFTAAGFAPSANSRLPLPSTTGYVKSRYSSTRSCCISVWTRPALPCTCSSRPALRLSSATSVATSPRSSVEPFHDTSWSVRDATYLGRPLRRLAIGSSGSVTFGQAPAKISYVRRPSRNASASAKKPAIASSMSSSTYGTTQPPYSNPPLGILARPARGLCDPVQGREHRHRQPHPGSFRRGLQT